MAAAAKTEAYYGDQTDDVKNSGCHRSYLKGEWTLRQNGQFTTHLKGTHTHTHTQILYIIYTYAYIFN